MPEGVALTSVSIAQAALKGRLPGGPGLRLVDLGPDFDPMVETGHRHLRPAARTRRLRPVPPLNLLWPAFADEVTSGLPYSL